MCVHVCVFVAVPRHPSHNQVWEFDNELGATAEDVKDDPGQCVFVLCTSSGLTVLRLSQSGVWNTNSSQVYLRC